MLTLFSGCLSIQAQVRDRRQAQVPRLRGRTVYPRRRVYHCSLKYPGHAHASRRHQAQADVQRQRSRSLERWRTRYRTEQRRQRCLTERDPVANRTEINSVKYDTTTRFPYGARETYGIKTISIHFLTHYLDSFTASGSYLFLLTFSPCRLRTPPCPCYGCPGSLVLTAFLLGRLVGRLVGYEYLLDFEICPF